MAADDGDRDRARLSKGAVLDRALKLADADGLDALTIRKLAQDLGVTPMALYWHFRSKDELLEGLNERVWGEVEVSSDPSVPWAVQLRSGLESLLTALRAHPSAPQLMLEHEKRSAAALRAMDSALETLSHAGFSPQQAVAVARSTLYTAIMLVQSEPGRQPGVSATEIAEEMRRHRIEFSLLPVDQFPQVVANAAELTSCEDPEFHYTFGVTLFIAGVKAVAPHP